MASSVGGGHSHAPQPASSAEAGLSAAGPPASPPTRGAQLPPASHAPAGSASFAVLPAGGSDGSPGPPPGSGAFDLTASSSADYSPLADSPVNQGNNATRVIKRRAPVACRRCRRMRSKCVHFGAKPPCEGCRIAGVSLDECVFPTRGTPDLDRDYRHPRMKGDKARKEGTRFHRPQLSGGSIGASGPHGASSASSGSSQHLHSHGAVGPPVPADLWELLPPLEQIVDAVNMFTHQYFQLGFIPRHTFVQQLREQPGSVSVFLLLGVLSVSARMTPSLVEAYGDAVTTAELFMERASAVALTELYQEPTLARCQAFYLLSLAQQGSGYRNRSFVNLGIALRMAILMQLHHEETYTLDESTPAMVQKAESARRTLWMLYSQDNLHAGPLAPVSLAASDITTLLPSNEEDFNNGVLPKMRAALEDTPPARDNPALVASPTRSLFATLMQSHQLWGIVLRRAVRNDRSMHPWDSSSDYAAIKKKLGDWESHVPRDHLWSRTLLRDFKAQGLDLAYVAVTMVTRLCNIVIRKAYIPYMLMEGGAKQHRTFWKTMSSELFSNVKELFTQIDCWIQEREPSDGTGAQLAVFCVYSCGLMAAYLCKYPNLCPDVTITREGQRMLDRTMGILSQSTNVWPLARRWLESVEKLLAADKKSLNIVSSAHEGGMAEGKDPIPSALHPPITYSAPSGPSNTPFDDRRKLARQFGPDSPHARSASPSVNGNINGHGSGSSNGMNNGSAGHVQRHPPQLRTNDSLLNSSMLLPPPHPSPNLVTTAAAAAAHYATSATAHYATSATAPPPPPLLLPPAAPQGMQTGGGMTTPTSLAQAQVPPQMSHQNHQHLHQQQPSPHHGIITGSSNSGAIGAISPGMAISLAAGSTSVSPTSQRPPLPTAAQAHADSRINMMVQDFDMEANTTDEAAAAAVLVSGMVPHGALSYGAHPQSHPHHHQQQHHANPYAMHHLQNQGHVSGPVGHLPGSDVSVVGPLQTAGFYEPVLTIPDDGFQNELQFMIQGQEIPAGAAWGQGVFGI